jgi:hypothetical protein
MTQLLSELTEAELRTLATIHAAEAEDRAHDAGFDPTAM